MITAILIIVCILSSGFTGNIYKKLSDGSHSVSSSALMPSLWFFILGVLFTVIFAISPSKASYSLIPVAMVSGACIFLAAFILIESMKVNSLSISVILINLNFVFPVILSHIFLSEHARLIQIIGLALSVSVIVILNAIPSSDKKSLSGAIFIPLAASVANGLVNFCIKINGHNGGDENFFFAVMYFTAAISSVVVWLMLTIFKKEKIAPKISTGLLPFILLMALCNGVCFYMTSLLSLRMDATAQFTIVTSASILLSITVGVFFQKERLTSKSLMSMLFCAIAILCQCVGTA